MARQKGAIAIQGTIKDLTFYKMDGENLVRRKSSLDKKRIASDPAFANSRKSSGVFGKAAAIAGVVYHALPKEKKKHGFIGKLTGIANTLLHEGKSEAEVKAALETL